jgi:hypothetical protein
LQVKRRGFFAGEVRARWQSGLLTPATLKGLADLGVDLGDFCEA